MSIKKVPRPNKTIEFIPYSLGAKGLLSNISNPSFRVARVYLIFISEDII